MPTKHPFTDDYEPITPPARARAATRAAEGEGDPWAFADARTEQGAGNFARTEQAAGNFARTDNAGRGHEIENAARPRTPDGDASPLADANGAAKPAAPARFKRGHFFSYVGLFLFTVVLYFRPYELHASLAGLTSLAYWLAFVTLLIFL
ncbi:MAG TPA: hypothetical protein VEZ40_21030, partial [Pyrinomonadaceae bacterium]|nr:hypothetical protein [Pyrinomonadaceae bacterium]